MATDNRGWTAVHHAAFHGYHGILQVHRTVTRDVLIIGLVIGYQLAGLHINILGGTNCMVANRCFY